MWGKKKAKLFIYNSLASIFVPTTGFEPAHLMAPPPQDGMSTNFTTWACCKIGNKNTIFI